MHDIQCVPYDGRNPSLATDTSMASTRTTCSSTAEFSDDEDDEVEVEINIDDLESLSENELSQYLDEKGSLIKTTKMVKVEKA